MASTKANLRGLVLSAAELRSLHPDWSESFIEDYLNIFDNLVILSDAVDGETGTIKNVTFVDTTPYEIKDTDTEIFIDTTDSPIIANLRPGVDGRSYRIVNIGDATKDNAVTVNPFGSEELLGDNDSEILYPVESLIITFNTAGGWN